MVELSNKVVLFRNMIWNEMKQQSEHQLYAYAEQNSQLIEQKREALKREAENYITSHVQRAQLAAREQIAVRKQENQRVFLETQRQCFDALTESIRQKFADFVTTKAYRNSFQQRLREALASVGEASRLYVLERDRALAQEIVGPAMPLSELPPSEIGGFILVNADETQRVRLTFEKLIEDNTYRIGRALDEWMRHTVLTEAVTTGGKERA